jgi:hypothetical protein
MRRLGLGQVLVQLQHPRDAPFRASTIRSLPG